MKTTMEWQSQLGRYLLVLVMANISACGGEQQTAPVVAAAVPAKAGSTAEVTAAMDPDSIQPDASIPAVSVDASSASAGGTMATPDAPIIESVSYEDLAYVVGEKIIIKTNLKSTRQGVLKSYFTTSLKLLAEERGRVMEMDIPRATVAEVQVVWTHPQGAAASSAQ